MKICVITAKTPFSPKETFILDELLVLSKISDVLVVPREVKGKIVKGAESLNVLAIPLFSAKSVTCFFLSLFKKNIWKIIRVIFSAQNKKTILKNLAILPKSIYLSEALQAKNIDHIHAHWGGTTGTMALIINLLTGIPFSITFHRWDIAENNLAKEKVGLAKFVRTISNSGKNDLKKLLPKELHQKIAVIHMGVNVPAIWNKKQPTSKLMLINVGNLVTEKGQDVFLQSLKILKCKEIKFQAEVFGDGPLRQQLINQSVNLGISENIKFRRHANHQELLSEYSKRSYGFMVSTSVTEGIPVALMEAMAYGIPVIANNAGGVSELIEDGVSGFFVNNNLPELIAEKIILLFKNRQLADMVIRPARDKINRHFNVNAVARELLKKMS